MGYKPQDDTLHCIGEKVGGTEHSGQAIKINGCL